MKTSRLLNFFSDRIKYIYQILKILIFLKFEYNQPQKTRILFFDAMGYDYFKGYFKINKPSILHIRGEVFNLPTIFRLIAEGKKLNYFNYFLKYIELADPQIILTFNDCNDRFYFLKKFFKKKIFVSIQNAYRSIKFDDLFNRMLITKERYECDYVLTFSKNIGNQYLKSINAKNIAVGSIKNNLFTKNIKVKNSKKIKSIGFISQFRRAGTRKNNLMLGLPRNIFYKPESILLPFLLNYCKNKKILLKIIACNSANSGEKKYFDDILGTNKYWRFIEHKNQASPYNALSEVDLVTMVDSTMGYEALSLGKKVVGFNCRKHFLKNKVGFGWPYYSFKDGKYWTNKMSLKRFEAKLNFVSNLSNKEWGKEISIFRKNVMTYDKDNQILRKFINKIQRIN